MWDRHNDRSRGLSGRDLQARADTCVAFDRQMGCKGWRWDQEPGRPEHYALQLCDGLELLIVHTDEGTSQAGWTPVLRLMGDESTRSERSSGREHVLAERKMVNKNQRPFKKAAEALTHALYQFRNGAAPLWRFYCEVQKAEDAAAAASQFADLGDAMEQ